MGTARVLDLGQDSASQLFTAVEGEDDGELFGIDNFLADALDSSLIQHVVERKEARGTWRLRLAPELIPFDNRPIVSGL